MNKYKGLYHQFCTSIYKLENAQKYVEDTIRKVDWNSYAISKHIPRSIRQDYLNICQFHNELARIEETTKEKSLGAGKLQFWANAIDQIFEDKPPKEPLAICLHHTCKSNPLPKYLFTKMITFKLRQIEQPEFMNLSQMALAAETNRGLQFLLVLRLLRQDIEDPILKQTVELASQSVGITDFIKRVPFTLQNYKLQLPEDIKYKHSINVRNLWDRIKGKPKEELYDAILEVAAFSRNIMIQSAQFQSQLPPQAFRAFLHLSAAEYYLEQLEYYNFNVFEKYIKFVFRSINQNSYVQLPLRIFQNCRNSKYLSNDYP